jgi:hypothetical protein
MSEKQMELCQDYSHIATVVLTTRPEASTYHLWLTLMSFRASRRQSPKAYRTALKKIVLHAKTPNLTTLYPSFFVSTKRRTKSYADRWHRLARPCFVLLI